VKRALVVLALAGASFAAAPAASADVLVRFELNDALVKGRALPGVEVSVARASGGGAVAATRSPTAWPATCPTRAKPRRSARTGSS